jgi:hypothetical protein
MKVIGLPFFGTEFFHNTNEDVLLSLFPSAIKNKVPLLFLEHAVALCKRSEYLEGLYQSYLKKSQSVFGLIDKISDMLSRAQTEYAIFKTLKPFPFTTVDIDILFFGYKEFMQAYRALKSLYKLAGYGAYSISLYDPKNNMNLDLHLEISVSRMVYVNKQFLQRHLTEVNINGIQTSVLEPPAALATVIAHSLYKEQIFTLADYYTIIIQMLRMTLHERGILIDLAEQLNVKLSFKLAFTLVDTLTKIAFRRNISVIADTAQKIQINEIEEKAIQIAVNQFLQHVKLPYVYPPVSVALAFTMKTLKDSLMRSTMPQQFLEIITNTSEFLKSTSLHIKRATY